MAKAFKKQQARDHAKISRLADTVAQRTRSLEISRKALHELEASYTEAVELRDMSQKLLREKNAELTREKEQLAEKEKTIACLLMRPIFTMGRM